MTAEELDASIELAKLVGFSCLSVEGGWLVFGSDGDSVCETPCATESEAWVDAFWHGEVQPMANPMPRYGVDLNATFALALERGIGLQVHADKSAGLSHAHCWVERKVFPVMRYRSPALAACYALIAALEAMKGDGA